MPRYTNDQLRFIAIALNKQGWTGAANSVYWWNATYNYIPKAFPIMLKPLAEMPLYISDEDECTRIIAIARLAYKKGTHEPNQVH